MNAPDAGHARRGRVLMLASAVFFIANVLLVRAIGARYALDAWVISSTRFLIGLAIVFLPLMPGGAVNLRSLLRSPLVIARGVIGGTAVAIFYATIPDLGAGRATFINNTYILWGALMAALFLRERVQARMVGAMLVGLVGVGLLTGVSAHGWAFSRADALAILGSVFSAIVVVIIRRLREHETIATIFGSQCAWGLVATAVPTVTGWATPGAVAVVLLVVSGVLAAAGQVFMTAGFQRLPVAEGSLLQMLVPVGIAAGGVALFDERYATPELAGALLIIGSCVLGAWTRPRIAAVLPKDFQR